MKPNESVDSAKIHTAGANPNNNSPASANAPARHAANCPNDTRAPASVENIYKLGKQITLANPIPAVIFNGAAHNCSCFAKHPSTNPNNRNETSAMNANLGVAP